MAFLFITHSYYIFLSIDYSKIYVIKSNFNLLLYLFVCVRFCQSGHPNYVLLQGHIPENLSVVISHNYWKIGRYRYENQINIWTLKLDENNSRRICVIPTYCTTITTHISQTCNFSSISKLFTCQTVHIIYLTLLHIVLGNLMKPSKNSRWTPHTAPISLNSAVHFSRYYS